MGVIFHPHARGLSSRTLTALASFSPTMDLTFTGPALSSGGHYGDYVVVCCDMVC